MWDVGDSAKQGTTKWFTARLCNCLATVHFHQMATRGTCTSARVSRCTPAKRRYAGEASTARATTVAEHHDRPSDTLRTATRCQYVPTRGGRLPVRKCYSSPLHRRCAEMARIHQRGGPHGRQCMKTGHLVWGAAWSFCYNVSIQAHAHLDLSCAGAGAQPVLHIA